MKRTAAIDHAKRAVKPLSRLGDRFRFARYDGKRQAYIESPPQPYQAAERARAAALIWAACEAMNYPWTDRLDFVAAFEQEEPQARQTWTDYVPQDEYTPEEATA